MPNGLMMRAKLLIILLLFLAQPVRAQEQEYRMYLPTIQVDYEIVIDPY